MKKKEPRQVLNEFSLVYMFFVVVGIILAILVLLVPAIPDAFKEVLDDKDNVVLVLETTLITRALIDFWYYWLIRRYTSGKSNGNLIMWLLIIGVVGNLISMLFTKGAASLNLVIDAVVLYFLLKAKKTDK